VNATTDKSSTVSFKDLELEAGQTSEKGFGTKDFAEDKDGNGLLDAIDHWPEFIDRVTGPVQPFRRSAGVATVAGIPVLLQFLVYNPGTTFDLPGEDLEKLLPKDPALGFPTIVLLQDVGDPEIEPEPGPITDFCTPLTSTNIASGKVYDADRDGTDNKHDSCPYDAHPVMGTHDADFDFLDSQCDPDDNADTGKNEDQDSDGTDNFADNCPLVANPDQKDTDGDGIGDADGDGLDAACDPNDDPTSHGTNTDQDADGYLNRQDNCPLVPNGQESKDQPTGNQHDADFDQIGDVCDTSPDTPDGELLVKTLTADVTIGAGGAGGPPTNCPDCEKPTDDPAPKRESLSPNPQTKEDNGGSDTTTYLIIGGAIAAAVVVLGGGATLL